MTDDLRGRVLAALAVGDGQNLDGFDLGHTAEIMYGGQADAVLAVVQPEIDRLRIIEVASIGAHALLEDADAANDRVRALLDLNTHANHQEFRGDWYVDLDDLRAALDGPGE